MVSNPLIELQKLGQSVWYDNIRRTLITGGDLERKVREDGLRGVTSNPAIFEKAIAGSQDYDASLQELAREGKDAQGIYEALVIEDIQRAADVLEPVYQETDGRDGYVSLEVSPLLAHHAEGTIVEAIRLWETLGRQNTMIKVPATSQGLVAIEALTAAGINVNVTLIFSRTLYQQVALAFLSGLKIRAAKGAAVDRVASVASFFVSRIDVAVDHQLQDRIVQAKGQEKTRLSSLLGKVAIANAVLAFQDYKALFGGERFQVLQQGGASSQRLLWASTATKNPEYSDVLYVESLIGPHTVNTIPPATYTAFRDHGRASLTLEDDVESARNVLEILAEVGIDLESVSADLLVAGVQAFAEPFQKLMRTVDEKRESVTSIAARQALSSAGYGSAVEGTIQRMEREEYVRRIWRKDAGLWKDDAAHQEIIRNSLGWLGAAQIVMAAADELTDFTEEVRSWGYGHIVVLGMGGSSLCAEVLRRTFGRIEGYPELLVLDSTDPAMVRNLEDRVEVGNTLFIVASKSGTTTEPLMFYKYFMHSVSQVKPGSAGENFVAITDGGSKLEEIAVDQGFRRVFRNMSDIGGRYSALSFFGMVPASLMGLDLGAILERATVACEACERCVPAAENPAARLGALLGELARQGRDKVTFVISPPIDSLGLWIEQLIAESTGKEGKGILPVVGEPLGDRGTYGEDRVFVSLRTSHAPDEGVEAKLRVLEEAGHPVVRQVLKDALSLGREFFLWEMATALAGAVLGINPFDQPNVQESKDNTKRLLQIYQENGSLPEQDLLVSEDGCRIYGDPASMGSQANTLAAVMSLHLARVKVGDYVALTVYLPETERHDQLLQGIRLTVREACKVATTVGYGPRFLHSTGQLHKGGADNGIFIQITADDVQDVPIPGEPLTFGVLKQAQALGDFESLANRGRRIIRFHLGSDVESGLEKLLTAVSRADGNSP